ncbi:MAG: hypothetical protein B7X95_05025 [Methylophilaceae bacterium 17-44-8]|jgi:predicted ATP-grasp superfamily ATP-dependent carboligase|nr:MAG: hypothetical protein B7Y48_00605 [Methylophilales bacterium 28-44-11]OYY96599.1 MAG: hypothetical protein B7Y32_07115 [Methylophilales bacterium 16-45-7]OZA05844.1 MAG: hypothetical protein B7X95_05025 [Methylophilaceae bacterium 17-44-8]
MQSQRTLLVCEFITGGGLVGADLPESLAREGALMRDALLRDLILLNEWQIITTHDARVPPPDDKVNSHAITPEQDIWAVWRDCMALADAVWVIAPESEGVLLRIAELANANQALWIGATQEAIAISSDKYRMAQVLAKAKLPVIPSYIYEEWMPNNDGSWVVKPNDGAGCAVTFVFSNAKDVNQWFDADARRSHTHIIQPYLLGIPASISVIGSKHSIIVLSCNLQSMRLHHEQLSYTGGVINGAVEYWVQLSELAQQVKEAIPGLMGYFGIDVLLHTDVEYGISIIEINPRLTTSYVYLNEAIGCNPAKLVLDAMFKECVDVTAIKRNLVEFNVEN